MSASDLILTLLVLQSICLLEPIVLLLSLWLLTYCLITGTPPQTVLQDITVVEDDIFFPHPPGFLNASGSADLEGDVSTCSDDLDATDISSLDYSISSTIDFELSVPAINITSASTSCLLEPSFEHRFDLKPVVEESNNIVEVALECFSSNKAGVTGIFQSPGSSSISEQRWNTPGTHPTTTSCTQHHSSEYLSQSIHIPANLDERPVFSRHSVTGNVIFPVRKPPVVSQAPRDSFDINSVLKRMPTNWTREHRREVPESLRIAMSGVIGSSITRKEQEAIVAGYDVYDSWPYIRTEIEQDIEGDREKAEEDTFVSVLKWAVSTLRA